MEDKGVRRGELERRGEEEEGEMWSGERTGDEEEDETMEEGMLLGEEGSLKDIVGSTRNVKEAAGEVRIFLNRKGEWVRTGGEDKDPKFRNLLL